MLKKIVNLGQTLSKEEQKEVTGGRLVEETCNNPYINPGGPCDPGYHPHAIYGHCICCAD